jgi:hypothetical protein
MDSAEESQDPSPLLFKCSVCSELRDRLNGSTCSVCVTPILVSLWPRLIEVLEQKYGRQLDEWLENGRFEGLSWSVSPEFTVPTEALRPFVKKLLEDAVLKEGILFEPPGSRSWVPSETEELVESVYTQCETSLRRLITRELSKAVKRVPTLKAERELIETICGRREVRPPDTLEDAIYAAVYTPANPLPHGARTLIDIRYREDKQGELELHTEFADWVIDPVWGELGDELPPDLAGLLPEEEDWV